MKLSNFSKRILFVLASSAITFGAYGDITVYNNCHAEEPIVVQSQKIQHVHELSWCFYVKEQNIYGSHSGTFTDTKDGCYYDVSFLAIPFINDCHNVKNGESVTLEMNGPGGTCNCNN